MRESKITIQDVFKKYPDEEICLKIIFYNRYNDNPFKCPHCNNLSKFFLILRQGLLGTSYKLFELF